MTEAYSGPHRIHGAFRIYGEVSFAKIVNAKQKNIGITGKLKKQENKKKSELPYIRRCIMVADFKSVFKTMSDI